MSCHEAGVDAEPALQPVEPAREVAPLEIQAFLEGLERHAFHPRKHRYEVACRLGVDRRQPEPAVATENRGDSVQGGWRHRCVPHDVRVVVGVDIDEARRYHQAGRVNGAVRSLARLLRVSDENDPPTSDADIALPRRPTSSVDDRPAGDQQVKHRCSSNLSRLFIELSSRSVERFFFRALKKQANFAAA